MFYDPRPLPARLELEPYFCLTIGFGEPVEVFSFASCLDLTFDPLEFEDATPPCGDPPGLFLVLLL